MNPQPKVSVIIPVYNVAPYLDECLESVCAQTYQNLEIILIDDGSTDGSGDACDKWGEKDCRIQVIHQKNGGVSSARNAGLCICTGDLITFVDSDDWIELDMFEKLVQCLTENHSDAAICGYIAYPHGVPESRGVFTVPPCDFAETAYQMIRRNGCYTIISAKMLRREIIFKNGGFQAFDLSLSCGEDEVWLFQTLRNCEKVAFVPEALYYWRPREGSSTRTEIITDKRLSVLDAKRIMLSLLPDNDRIRRLARGRTYNECFPLKVKAYCTGNKKAFRRISKEIRPMWWDWIRSPEVIPMRKCKLLVLEAEILCRLPRKLVKKTYTLTH